MKFATINSPSTPRTDAANEVGLPSGLVGFPDHKRMDLVYLPEQLPFLWMRLHGPTPVNFVVIEPGGIIADYEPEIFDEDASDLGITSSEDAMLLNIVCLNQARPHEATVNLTGPVIINRRTGIGKQVVLANHARYSARHRLLSQPAVAGAA
jgi:flagellar assembly factor FliW